MVFCVSILCLLNGCDKQEYISPEEVFVKLYGSSGEEKGIDFLETEDGFVILMQTNSPTLMRALPSTEELNQLKEDNLLQEEQVSLASQLTYGSNESDYLLIFTDRSGNVTERLAIGHIRSDTIINNVLADSEDIPSSILRTVDGGYLITGTSTYTVKEIPGKDEPTLRQSDVFVVKVSSDRKVVFQKVYGYVFYPENRPASAIIVNESGADAIETADGYIIFGTTTLIDKNKYRENQGISTEDRSDFYIIKVSLDGATTYWQRSRGFPEAEQAVSILANSNECANCAVIMGRTSKASQAPVLGGGGSNVIFARLDEEGFVKGAGYFGFDGDENPTRMRRISNDNFYIVGTYQESGKKDKAFLFEITINANLRFPTSNSSNSTLPSSLGPKVGSQLEEDVEGNDALQIPGQGYWVIGSIKQFNGATGSKGAEMLIMRTTIDGRIDNNFGKESIYGLNYGGVEDDQFSRILQLNSGHLLLLGTLSFGGTSTMACLMKTDKEGRLQAMP